MDDEKIRLREEVQEQIRALNELKEMAATYGDDISKPAANSREAVQVRACQSCMPTAHSWGILRNPAAVFSVFERRGEPLDCDSTDSSSTFVRFIPWKATCSALPQDSHICHLC